MEVAVTRVTWTLLLISAPCKNVITAEDILIYGVQKMEETVLLGISVEKA